MTAATGPQVVWRQNDESLARYDRAILYNTPLAQVFN